MWFDSHCHLHLCEEDDSLDEVVARARTSGVTEMVAVGIEVGSSERVLAIAREHDGVYASAGVHPNDAGTWNDEAKQRVDGLLDHEKVVAVGESGLDFYRDHTPHDVQRTVFRDHIALAKDHGKALIIHTRDSTSAAIEELEVAGPPERFVFHCWSGDETELGRVLALGGHVSFAGNVSFKSAANLREVARLVPGDRLLVETDSPFLAPVPRRDRPNEPAFVAFVGRAVAEARNEASSALAARTSSNARRLFGLG